MNNKTASKTFEAAGAKLDSVRLDKYEARYGKHPGTRYQVVVECVARDAEKFADELAKARKVAKKAGCRLTVDAEGESVILTMYSDSE